MLNLVCNPITIDQVPSSIFHLDWAIVHVWESTLQWYVHNPPHFSRSLAMLEELSYDIRLISVASFPDHSHFFSVHTWKHWEWRGEEVAWASITSLVSDGGQDCVFKAFADFQDQASRWL